MHQDTDKQYDFFISHASEDKAQFVRSLAENLERRGAHVWYDEFELKVGRSLRGSIDRGLRESRFGIVVLSKHFFMKPWPQSELDGLVSLNTLQGERILPVWLGVTVEDVQQFSPILAGIFAIDASVKSIEQVTDELMDRLSDVDVRIASPTLDTSLQSPLDSFCEESYARWRSLAESTPEDSPARFHDGYYEFAVSILGASPLTSLTVVQDALINARRTKLTYWPPFMEIQEPGWEPRPFGDSIEAWLGRPVPNNPYQEAPVDESDYWRVTKTNQLYTIRGFIEDERKDIEAGTVIGVSLPITSVAESLSFATRYAKSLPESTTIAVRVHFSGLTDRRLISLPPFRYRIRHNRICRVNEVTLNEVFTTDQINNNLAQVIHQLLIPLYEQFGLFELTTNIVYNELNEMLTKSKLIS